VKQVRTFKTYHLKMIKKVVILTVKMVARDSNGGGGMVRIVV
jgi:hypothetical protein